MVARQQATTGTSRAVDTTAAAAPMPLGWQDLLAVLVVAVLDCGLTGLLIAGVIGYATAMAGHAVLVAGLCALVLVWRTPGADRTMLALAALATACVGPLGAVGAVLATLLAPARQTTTPLLEAWYQRIAHSIEIDPTTQLCDMVAIGRAVDLSGGPPPSFAQIMTTGGLGERQALLGHIARHFHVDYLPALKIALANPEPVIRVQAAAVASKVQHALSGIVATWAARTAGPMTAIEALGAVVELEACLGSGLIEAADRSRAEAALAVAHATARSASTSAGLAQHLLASRGDGLQLTATAAYERVLVGERRFRELRNWRRLQRVGRRPGYRLRPRRLRRGPRQTPIVEAAQ